jgi:hypothetical protein
MLGLVCLAGCSWFGANKSRPLDPTELIVSGAPNGSVVFIDGVQIGSAPAEGTHPRVVYVKPGSHVVEVRVGAPVVYREETYVAAGEKRLVTVLSGSNR